MPGSGSVLKSIGLTSLGIVTDPCHIFNMTDEIKRPKRPRDANQLAKSIVDIATGVEPEIAIEDSSPDLSKAKGGKARAKSLNPEQRSEIASIAATARWKKNS